MWSSGGSSLMRIDISETVHALTQAKIGVGIEVIGGE